jgi:class 3 adenylate cyclase
VTGERVERRLAAVLAANVAGYSRLMGTDEVGTLAARKPHRREVVDPAIAGCPVATSSPGGFRSPELIRKVREALLKAGLPMTTRPPHC